MYDLNREEQIADFIEWCASEIEEIQFTYAEESEDYALDFDECFNVLCKRYEDDSFNWPLPLDTLKSQLRRYMKN